MFVFIYIVLCTLLCFVVYLHTYIQYCIIMFCCCLPMYVYTVLYYYTLLLFTYICIYSTVLLRFVVVYLQIKREIEVFKNQGIEMEERRKVILREMEAELVATEEQCNNYGTRQAATLRVIEQLKSGICVHTYIRMFFPIHIFENST